MTSPTISFSLLDSAGNVLAERVPHEPFYAASTIKLAVMLAAALEIDAGRLRLDDRLVCGHTFPSGVPDAPRFAVPVGDRDTEFPPEGAEATVGDLIDMMITRSSNEATNVLAGRVGLQGVADAITRSGASGTTMRRLIGDTAAADAGLTNTVTAADLSTLIHCIATGQAASAAMTGFMRATLGRQQHVRIAAELPSGAVWGSKSGNVDGIEHDVAFVGDADSPAARYLAICTRGYGEGQGREAIRAIAAALLPS